MSVSPADLDRALPLMADRLLHPVFSEEAVGLLKQALLASLRRSAHDGRVTAATVFKRIFYGPTHPYALEQNETTAAAITPDDVMDFYRRYFRPPNVRFVVTGDLSSDSAVAKLNRHFGQWEAGASAQAEVPPASPPAERAIYLVDSPNASHSVLWVAGSAPRRDTPDYADISVMNTILGGENDSRLNRVLRDERKYAVGAQSEFYFRPVPEAGSVIAVTSVKTAVTDSALTVFLQELRDIGGSRPVTEAEVAATLPILSGRLARELGPGTPRTLALMDLYVNHLPLDHFHALAAALPGVTQERAAATGHYVSPESLVIVVVGDRAKIEAPLRALGIAPVVPVDRTGKRVP